jgi:hypothetical protein
MHFLIAPERDTGSQLSTSHTQKMVSGIDIFILQNIMCLYATGLQSMSQKIVANFSETYRYDSVAQNRNIQNTEIF